MENNQEKWIQSFEGRPVYTLKGLSLQHSLTILESTDSLSLGILQSGPLRMGGLRIRGTVEEIKEIALKEVSSRLVILSENINLFLTLSTPSEAQELDMPDESEEYEEEPWAYEENEDEEKPQEEPKQGNKKRRK